MSNTRDASFHEQTSMAQVVDGRLYARRIDVGDLHPGVF